MPLLPLRTIQGDLARAIALGACRDVFPAFLDGRGAWPRLANKCRSVATVDEAATLTDRLKEAAETAYVDSGDLTVAWLRQAASHLRALAGMARDWEAGWECHDEYDSWLTPADPDEFVSVFAGIAGWFGRAELRDDPDAAAREALWRLIEAQADAVAAEPA